ncbi:hypothetical protein EZV62_012213 [Acer yangbiense]|uniref:Ubiquitin-like domain-containing protein n=1 Tax=Acer yangbiense TaxID=1000413 RepID=A0A5C7HV88_9ROSI|nr:hypothetical protein EZV62_012213 [Acer yangbiense]
MVAFEERSLFMSSLEEIKIVFSFSVCDQMEPPDEIVIAMYIRVKRSKATYFIQCDPTETILDIKQKLHVLIDQPVNDQRLILMGTGEVLEDSKTLADQKVENDAIVALTLRKDDNEFEDIDIVKPNDFYQSRDADGGSW